MQHALAGTYLMPDRISEIAGQRVWDCAPDGPLLAKESDVNALLGDAMGHDAAWVMLPAARLHGDFFRLRTGLAGVVAQKFANYRVGLAVAGDISAYLADSAPLRDFVREANRGGQLWFVDNRAAFETRLGTA